MTDSEIVKALQCCSFDFVLGDCGECPNVQQCPGGCDNLREEVIELIRWQKDMIEKLQQRLVK